MANKITYNDKAPFQNDPDIPDDNKVLAKNMNEIKTVVNANADELNKANQNIENLQSGQGTSNADITSLKNRVSTLETDNTTNKSNITNLQSNKVDKVEGKGLSTEDFTTELKSKLESLENYDDTEIKEDISNLESEQTEQDKQIDMLINALPSETSEAENINIKGTIPVKFKEFVVGGNSKQETRSGKNMINVLKNTLTTNGITFTNNGDGSVTINGTATGTAFFPMHEQTFTIENGKTYSLYLGGTTNGLNMAVRRASINTQLFMLSNAQEAITTTYNGETVDDAYAYLRVEVGTVLNNVTVYPMLVKGSEIGEWEQYGAMPSPEFISKIENVEGNVDITVCSKNLFNKSATPNIYSSMNVEETETGLKLEVIGSQQASYRFYKLINISNYVGKTVRMKSSIEPIDENSAPRYNLGLCSEDFQTRKSKKSTNISNEEILFTITAEDIVNTPYIAVWLYPRASEVSGGGGATFNNIIVTVDNAEMSFVSHQSQTITFPLQEGQKLMKNDYLAEDGIHHKRNQIELDGTENIIVNQATYNIFKIKDINDIGNDGSTTSVFGYFCSHFKEYTQVQLRQNNIGFCALGEGVNAIYLCFGAGSEVNSVEACKSFLAQQKQAGTPIIVEYELAEEETEAYTEEQQEAYNQLINLKAYEEETNVYSTNSTSPIFKVTAVKDINSVITQLNSVLLERS